jgi:hypothetical protein
MAPAESPFCDTCQRNQMLVQNMMAEYIPDDDDPEYNKYVASADSYRTELEQRYPQVCDHCIGPVREQIRAAGYAAKADHFRRILERSKENTAKLYSPRQNWTLRAISFGKWTYVISTLFGLIFHAFGFLVEQESSAQGNDYFSWNTCLSQAFSTWQVEQWCYNSTYMQTWAQYAILADLLTLWWNPKLEQKTVRFGGRMQRLYTLWLMRLIVIGLRYASLSSWHLDNLDRYHDRNALQSFHLQHGVMLAILVLSLLVTWKTVRIEYQSTAGFMKPIDPHLPNAPNSIPSSADTSPYRPVRPDGSKFDTMAHGFISAFRDSSPPGLPPSPTLSVTSIRSHATDQSTPYIRRTTEYIDDSMDWTPTVRRFNPRGTEVVPSIFSRAPTAPAPKPPVSLFAKPDPNPFRHRVPAAPKSATRQDPWKPGVWAPALKESKENFFQKMMNDSSPNTRESLASSTVPRNVKRDAELFRQPQLKYDNYGTPKTTGLEDTFNSLFSD